MNCFHDLTKLYRATHTYNEFALCKCLEFREKLDIFPCSKDECIFTRPKTKIPEKFQNFLCLHKTTGLNKSLMNKNF